MIVFCTHCWSQNPPEAKACSACGAPLEPLSGTYIEKLISALHHPEPGAVQMAAWVLGERRERGAVSALSALLERSDEPGALEAAVEALGKIGDASVVGVLTRLAGGWPIRVRIKAAEALGRMGGLEAGQGLRAMLDDPNRKVREAARAALDALKDSSQAAKEETTDFGR